MLFVLRYAGVLPVAFSSSIFMLFAAAVYGSGGLAKIHCFLAARAVELHRLSISKSRLQIIPPAYEMSFKQGQEDVFFSRVFGHGTRDTCLLLWKTVIADA